MIKETEQRLKNEIEHGKKIAETAGEVWNWESPAGKMRWARRAKALTENILPDMDVLELGCGTGYFTKELAKTGAAITAIDISNDLLEKAREAVTSSQVRFLIENAYDMSFEDASFDLVVGSSVLHHLEIEKAVSEIFRILKPGGRACFTEPNMLNPQIALEKNVYSIGRRLGNTPDETAFWRWQIAGLLRKKGFGTVRITNFDFLHPAIPAPLAPAFEKLSLILEKTPLIKEISGSLLIQVVKS